MEHGAVAADRVNRAQPTTRLRIMDAVGGWAVPRKTVLIASASAVALAIPLAGGYFLAGTPAVVGIMMGYVALGRPAFVLRTRQAAAFLVPIAMVAVVAVALRHDAWAAACFVALTCLLVAPANAWKDALLVGVPSMAATLVAVPNETSPVFTGGWVLVGEAAILALGSRFPAMDGMPKIPQPVAWRHAAVMAVVVGGTVAAIGLLQWPRGYWIAMTLTVVLRPYDDQTRIRSWQRIAGTVGGGLVALLLASVLPDWAIGVAVLICMVLYLSYVAVGDYTRQVIFLTPTVILLASVGHLGETVVQRVGYTAVGAIAAMAIAAILARLGLGKTPFVPDPQRPKAA